MALDTEKVGTGLPEDKVDTNPDVTTLGEIGYGLGGSIETPIQVFLGSNLGHRTFITALPLHKFYDMSLVANREQVGDGALIAQRPLDLNHAKKMAVYMLKGLVEAAIQVEIQKKSSATHQATEAEVNPKWLRIRSELGEQPYAALQPIVVNIRHCKPNGTNMKMSYVDGRYTAYLSQAHKLWVVDGQHRRKGMEILFAFLEEIRSKLNYPKRGLFVPNWANLNAPTMPNDEMALWETCYSLSKEFVTIAVEIHLGLEIAQERQLFHDLNRLVKKIDVSMALDFDTSNPINQFTKDVLVKKLGLKVVDTEIKDWSNDNGAMTRKDVTSINARLFLNSGNINGATGKTLTDGQAFAEEFWTNVLTIPGFGQQDAHKNTVAAQPVVLKALAKLVFDLTLNRRKPANSDELLKRLMSSISSFDFSHENKMWRYYEFNESERIANGLSGLSAYLPSEETGNRDIGSYQDGYFRFGAKHNDIYPIIGDMIRWKLNLPSRNK